MYQRFTASYNIYESCISNLNHTNLAEQALINSSRNSAKI